MSLMTSALRRGDHVSLGLQRAMILPLRSLFVAVTLRSIFISPGFNAVQSDSVNGAGRSLPSVAAVSRASRPAATATAAAATALAGGVHLDISAVEHGLVQRAHGAISLFHRAEFDEAEATGLPCHPIDDHFRGNDAPVRLESCAQLRIAGGIRQIPDEQLGFHFPYVLVLCAARTRRKHWTLLLDPLPAESGRVDRVNENGNRTGQF